MNPESSAATRLAEAGTAGGPLQAFFAPRSIAVVGATERANSVGRALLENLQEFPGAIYPVNPTRGQVLGRPAFAAVGDIPHPVDLAVIATPPDTIQGIIAQCGQHGIKAAVVISAGFRECGPDGAKRERQLLAEARRHGVRLLGPNCLGLMVPGVGLNATFASVAARPGHIAFLSQSGALGTAILGWSRQHHVGFSAFVSTGAMADLSWGELIQHLGDDRDTSSIIIYMESVGDARSFLSAAREVTWSKPIIVLKTGRSGAAAAAAASHTGALTGSDEVLDAAFHRCGVLRVDTIGELFAMAETLAKQPVPPGPRLAIVTNAGGPGALAVDALIEAGGEPAELQPATLQSLDPHLPAAWSHRNPLDLLGDADPGSYRLALEKVLADPGTDGALVILTPQKMTDPAGTAAILGPVATAAGKPVLASWMGGEEVATARHLLHQTGIPVFEYPDGAARAFGAMWRRSAALRSIYETPEEVAAVDPMESGRDLAMKIIAEAYREGRDLLTEFEANQLMAAAGMPVLPLQLAKSPDEAVAAAGEAGYPVALKLHSFTLTHKSDVGGVALGLANADAVREAWEQMAVAVTQKAGEAAFAGATIQPMAPKQGIELILGSSTDPQFGPVLLFGAGGRLVEVWRDRSLALPPLTTVLARQMMERTRIFQALKGVRGQPPVDQRQLEALIVRFSQLVFSLPRIREIEFNPLLATSQGIVALDTRVALFPPALADSELPRPAIRPYPAAWVSKSQLDNGLTVTLRPIRPEDEPLLAEFHRSLSSQSVERRYLGPLDLGTRIAHERLARACFVDYDRGITLLAEAGIGANRHILGVCSLRKQPGNDTAAFTLVVGDPWQGHGLGTQLLRRILEFARAEGMSLIFGFVLETNAEMKDLCRRLGFRIEPEPGGRLCRVECPL